MPTRAGHGHGGGFRRVAPTALLACLVAHVVFTCGCGMLRTAGGGGDVRIRSVSADPVVVPGQFPIAVYTQTQETEYSFFLTDIPLEELLDDTPRDGQFLHIELLWRPRAGRTPLEATATNISITYIIFSNDEVGVYGGAGFAIPAGQPGHGPMSLNVRSASLSLIDATPGFVDLLSPAVMTGSVGAAFNRAEARRLRFAVSQAMTNRLGQTRIIRADDLVEPAFHKMSAHDVSTFAHLTE